MMPISRSSSATGRKPASISAIICAAFCSVSSGFAVRTSRVMHSLTFMIASIHLLIAQDVILLPTAFAPAAQSRRGFLCADLLCRRLPSQGIWRGSCNTVGRAHGSANRPRPANYTALVGLDGLEMGRRRGRAGGTASRSATAYEFLDQPVEAGEGAVEHLDLIADLEIDLDLVLGRGGGFLLGVEDARGLRLA